ncbi:hypothetical protein [Streptomyces sp. NPDC013489]|uniref:hypothetical protein n=1 Tax=Streptomyces sp. NPDC013489 TaxID=3155606 RepID=UPI0034004F15
MVDPAVVEVEAPEEQRSRRLLAHLLGAAAQMASERLGVGAGGGGVLAGDDLFGDVLGHPGQGGAAGVVVGAFAGELKVQ